MISINEDFNDWLCVSDNKFSQEDNLEWLLKSYQQDRDYTENELELEKMIQTYIPEKYMLQEDEEEDYWMEYKKMKEEEEGTYDEWYGWYTRINKMDTPLSSPYGKKGSRFKTDLEWSKILYNDELKLSYLNYELELYRKKL